MNLSQLARVAVTFCAVLSTYGLYSFAIVPFIEPPAEARLAQRPTDGRRGKSSQNRLKQFGRYFPKGAWELADAKVLESDQATIFVREYKNLQDGRVELHPFTMLFLPRDKRGDGSADDDARAIVLEAPQGALLQFDDRFDLKRAKLGKLIGGDLIGPIHIHNAPPAPGAADELDIRTRDVRLVGDKIVTPAKVDFRFGPNCGVGRDMTILLGQKETKGAEPTGVNFDGMRSFTLIRDVRFIMQLAGKGLLPGAPKRAAPAPNAGASATGAGRSATAHGAPGAPVAATGGPANASTKTAANGLAANGLAANGAATAGPAAGSKGGPPPKSDPPVEVTCKGPFKFDVARNVATFTDQVDVVRLNLAGPADTMRCEMLAIYFAERQPPVAAEQPAGASARHPPGVIKPPEKPQKPRESADAEQLSKLEPRLIEARGEPVIVHSPSNGGHSRCQRLEYDVTNGVIRLEDAGEVLLDQGPNEIRCKRLDYQPPKVGRLGLLTAIGPGTLQGTPEGEPTRRYQARWAKRLTMRPEGPLSLISLLGDAQMRLTDTGALSGEEIYIWVSEAASPPAGPNSPSPQASTSPPTSPPATSPASGSLGRQAETSGIQVERLLARQRVRIDSPQMTGATNKLEVWIDRPPPAPPATGPAPVAAAAAGPPPAAPPPPAPQPAAARPANPAQRFDVRGGTLRMRVAAAGPTMAVAEVDVDENARLVETKTVRPDEKPLLVRGNNLHVEHADTPNAHVIVSGRPGYVEARGMTLSGAVIQMERGANRLWIDGAGRMTLPMQGQLASPRSQSRGAAGSQRGAAVHAPAAGSRRASQRPAPAPGPPLEVTWQRSMQFDGLTARFDRTVLARAEHQFLRTELLQVTLKRRIDFTAPPPTDPNGQQPGGASEVDVVDCRGDVRLESREFDEKGLESIDQMELNTLLVNQTTGAIGGQGPGWVNTVRRGGPPGASPGASPGAALGGDSGGVPGPRPPAASKTPLGPAPPVAAPTAAASLIAAAPAAAPDNRLSYLHVTFERDLTGNIHRRELTFADRVRATYGPVDDWQGTIDPDDLASLGETGVVMTCDQLTVRETPSLLRTDRGTTELEAIGGTLVEGRSFTARAHRLTYAEAKDLLVLEGNGRSDAELYRQLKPGLPATKATARKIMFWRTTNRAEVDDARYIDMALPGSPASTPAFKDPTMKKK